MFITNVCACVFVEQPISDRDTEVESKVEGPGCKQDPACGVDKVQAASSGIVAACPGNVEPLDILDVDTQRARVVFHKRHTWAPLDSWPWGCAGHRKVSGLSAAVSGRGNSRST